MTKTTITFEGLMVFHKDTADLYELGILNAHLMGHHVPLHEFQIKITPDPTDGPGPWQRGPAELDRLLRASDRWSLEVKDASGSVEVGIDADESLPDRKSKTGGDNRFGWIVNLESSEFHKPTRPLARQTGQFKPIIRLSKGHLYTYCMTGGVNVVQNGNSRDFGFMAGLLALDIDTSAGQTVALKLDGSGTEVFALPAGTSYRVEITNITPQPALQSHFHAYYQMIFRGVPANQRFDFTNQEGVPHPDQCPTGAIAKTLSRVTILSTFPYRCGGLLINAGGEPLS